MDLRFHVRSDATGLVNSRADDPRFLRRVEREFSTDENNGGALRWPERELEQCEAYAVPNHLFWTWFVDNPRRNLQ